MKIMKFSTYLLLAIMVVSLTFFVGCGKKEESDDKKGNDTPIVDNDKKEEEQETQKVVKLLKRNGVEWKENTRINSSYGDRSYKVVWGDTLSLIARTWKVNCYKLAKYNNINNIDLIEVDQIIYNYAPRN